MIKIGITNDHGTFTTSTSALDLLIGHYLPASPLELRARLSETTGIPEHAYSDVRDVSELLIMLADAEGYAYGQPATAIPDYVPPGHGSSATGCAGSLSKCEHNQPHKVTDREDDEPPAPMRMRQHRDFSHGLEPGKDGDFNCTACRRENQSGTAPVITS